MIIDPTYQSSGGEGTKVIDLSDSKFLLPMRIAFIGRDKTWEKPMVRAFKWLNALIIKIAEKHDYELKDIYFSETPIELESDFDDSSITLTLLYEGFQYATITFNKEEI